MLRSVKSFYLNMYAFKSSYRKSTIRLSTLKTALQRSYPFEDLLLCHKSGKSYSEPEAENRPHRSRDTIPPCLESTKLLRLIQWMHYNYKNSKNTITDSGYILKMFAKCGSMTGAFKIYETNISKPGVTQMFQTNVTVIFMQRQQ